jgi:flagellar biosynthesis/type III secretory pathway chaperone
VSHTHDQRSFAEELCAALDAQLEQHGRLAALSEAQTAALSTRDVEGVEALTQTLETTVLEGPALEQRRAAAAEALAGSLGLDSSAVTLSQLVKAAPASIGELLSDRADRLERSIARLRRASAVNRVLIEGELHTIDRVMRATRRTERSTYSDRGAHDERLRALLDARA